MEGTVNMGSRVQEREYPGTPGLQPDVSPMRSEERKAYIGWFSLLIDRLGHIFYLSTVHVPSQNASDFNYKYNYT